MISYLVDAVLLIALAFTSMRVTRMHRELARLRSYQGEFSTIVHETAGAFDTVITAADALAGSKVTASRANSPTPRASTST